MNKKQLQKAKSKKQGQTVKRFTNQHKRVCELWVHSKDSLSVGIEAGYTEATAEESVKRIVKSKQGRAYLKDLKNGIKSDRRKETRRQVTGSPPHYETTEELQEQILAYFEDRETKKAKPTITGMAYFVGFESRQSVYDYGKRPKFSYAIKRALLYIESFHEENLYKPACTGSIFALKNRGWEDKVVNENENKHSGEVNLTFVEKTERDE